MNRRSIFLVLASAVVGAAAIAPSLLAQQQPAKPPQPVAQAPSQAPAKTAQPTPRPQAPAPEESRADIDFPGGTVAQFVEQVRRAFPGTNVVLEAGAEAVLVGPMKLLAITPADALIAACVTTSEGGKNQIAVDGHAGLYILRGHGPSASNDPVETRVWALQPVLETRKIKLEDAMTAVELGIKLTGGEASVKFHAETGLLLVRGNNEQLNAVNQVVARLSESFSAGREQLKAALEKAQAELNACRMELVELKQAKRGN